MLKIVQAVFFLWVLMAITGVALLSMRLLGMQFDVQTTSIWLGLLGSTSGILGVVLGRVPLEMLTDVV